MAKKVPHSPPPEPNLSGGLPQLPEAGAAPPDGDVESAAMLRIPRDVDLALPWLDEELPGYTPRKVDLHLTAEQAIALRRFAEALDLRQAKLDNGVRVTSGPLAVRWLLEHLGRQAETGLADAA